MMNSNVNEQGDPPTNGGSESSLRRGPQSGRSISPSFVRFFNRTVRSVDVIWLNYEGLGVRYRTLAAGQFLDVNTFVGHPWIFRDSQTGQRLLAQFQEVYEPREVAREGPPRRRIVNITIPVFSLKERCLQVIRSLVPIRCICELEIPKSLQTELQQDVLECDISMASSLPRGPATVRQSNPNNNGNHGNQGHHSNPSPSVRAGYHSVTNRQAHPGALFNNHAHTFSPYKSSATFRHVRPRLNENSLLNRMLTSLPQSSPQSVGLSSSGSSQTSEESDQQEPQPSTSSETDQERRGHRPKVHPVWQKQASGPNYNTNRPSHNVSHLDHNGSGLEHNVSTLDHNVNSCYAEAASTSSHTGHTVVYLSNDDQLNSSNQSNQCHPNNLPSPADDNQSEEPIKK